jgi:hypothetical protein
MPDAGSAQTHQPRLRWKVAASQAGFPRDPVRDWLRRAAPPSATLCIYLALTVALLSGGLFGGNSRAVGNRGDPALFMWDLTWAPYALEHGLNPFISAYQHYPQGFNLMWNTSILFPALVLAPLTKLSGPIASYNVLAVLGIALSSWCAYLALRRFVNAWLPAAIGGLLYGFSPYMLSQSLGHLQMALAMFPPLAVIFADEILVRQRHSPTRMGALLGITAAAQLLTGEELLSMTAVMSIIAVTALALCSRQQIRQRFGHAAKAAITAASTFIVLVAFPLYVQFFGPGRVSGPIQPLDQNVAFPSAFVSPTAQLAVQLLGQVSTPDSSAFIGLPLLAVAVASAVWLRRRTVIVVAGVVLLSSMVLSLGGFLVLHGGSIRIPLPWRVVDAIPILRNILPIRLMVFAYLALGLLLAAFLERIIGAGGPLRQGVGMLAAVVALAPLAPNLPYTSTVWHVPPFFTGGAVTRLPRGSVALVTPYYQDSNVLLWQALSGMRYKSPGAHGLFHARLDALGEELFEVGELGAPPPAQLSANQRSAYAADLCAEGVESVIVGPSRGEPGVVALMTDLLGKAGASIGGVVVWLQVTRGGRLACATPVRTAGT